MNLEKSLDMGKIITTISCSQTKENRSPPGEGVMGWQNQDKPLTF